MIGAGFGGFLAGEGRGMAVCEVICTVTRYLRIERHRSRIMHGISASFPRYTGRCARGRGHRGFERTSRGLPGGKALSFASPKESTQRKGDPRFVALRVPSAAHKRGPLRNSWLESTVAQKVEFVLATQTVLAEIPRVCSAARRLTWGPDRTR